MKIKSEHYSYMRDAMAVVAAHIPAHREAVIASGKFKDLEKRIRWDWSYMAGLTPWICDNVYPYADDSHLDTALRRIVSELSA